MVQSIYILYTVQPDYHYDYYTMLFFCLWFVSEKTCVTYIPTYICMGVWMYVCRVYMYTSLFGCARGG